MGGRYDRLADQFSANIPAIGFAFDIDLLMTGIPTDNFLIKSKIDVLVYDVKKLEKESLAIANNLRKSNYTIVTYPVDVNDTRVAKALFVFHIKTDIWC